MKIQDVMTRDVIAVGPDATVRDAARLMVDHEVSGLPVVDRRGAVVGVVSEGDLILRQKPRERAPWWRLFIDDAERLARDYQKAVGITVGEVMTRSVISVGPQLPIESAAAILDRHRIRRAPVVDDGRLVGIVSRGDLIKALAASPPRDETPRPDAQLAREMEDRLSRERWASKHAIVAHAEDGVLVLWGMVASEAEKSAVETMARAIPGVRGVQSHLVVRAALPYHYGV